MSAASRKRLPIGTMGRIPHRSLLLSSLHEVSEYQDESGGQQDACKRNVHAGKSLWKAITGIDEQGDKSEHEWN
jgi:hypothetical protein